MQFQFEVEIVPTDRQTFPSCSADAFEYRPKQFENLGRLEPWARFPGVKPAIAGCFCKYGTSDGMAGAGLRVRLVEDIQNTANGSPVHQIRIAASVAKFLPDKLQDRGVIQKLIENSLGRHKW